MLSQAEELVSLNFFNLSKTDDWSGAQLPQALADLNSEIIQLSASMAEEFASAFRTEECAPAVARERDRELVAPALFALQAWEVWCVARVMDAFCYGLPLAVEQALRMIFERIQLEEPQPTTSRWRALTYKHAQSLLARSRPSSEPTSPDTITPFPFNSAPASIVSTPSLPAPLMTLKEANLREALAILALAGCTDARGLLRARFGSALARISARAERIAGVVNEGVLSGLFDVVWVPACRSASGLAPPRRASAGEGAHAHVPKGTPRDKGKEWEWVK